MADFQTVKSYVQELNLVVVHEDPAQDILVVGQERVALTLVAEAHGTVHWVSTA